MVSISAYIVCIRNIKFQHLFFALYYSLKICNNTFVIPKYKMKCIIIMKISKLPNFHQLHSSFSYIIQSLSSVEGLHLTADNIQYHATFVHSSVSIQGRAINVAAGSSNKEKLLDVPIGHIDTHASIIITVGLNNTQPNTPSIDSDLVVGVSDGTNSNS